MKRLTNEKMAIILAVSVILSVTACSAEGVAYVDGNQSGTGFSSSSAATSGTIYEESTLPATVSVTTAATTTKAKETTAVSTTVASTPAIPPRPQPSPEAVSYKHLCEIYQKLQEQNKAIFALEKQRSDLEIELSDSKGIFKAKRRSELSTEIAGLEERISRMKARLSHIVKEYGYQNAEAFYKAFHKSETAYGDYQDSLKNWKQRYGEKPQSLHDRLISKKQDIKERELTRPYSPPNRGRSR